LETFTAVSANKHLFYELHSPSSSRRDCRRATTSRSCFARFRNVSFEERTGASNETADDNQQSVIIQAGSGSLSGTIAIESNRKLALSETKRSRASASRQFRKRDSVMPSARFLIVLHSWRAILRQGRRAENRRVLLRTTIFAPVRAACSE